MKKFVAALVLAKVIFLSVFAALVSSSCQTVSTSKLEFTPTPTATATATATPFDTNINRSTSDPYTGDLSIFEGEKRAENLQVERVLEVLKITEGKTVADIGAGSGWFTVLAAKKVGEKGKVFAVEINEDAIKYINERAKKENFTNIETILGTEDDPKLKADSVDAVLILKTYHEISQPVKLLDNLRKSLKKDALVGIIEKNGDGADHGIKKDTVIAEAEKAGFKLKEEHDFVKGDGMDYFLIFQVK